MARLSSLRYRMSLELPIQSKLKKKAKMIILFDILAVFPFYFLIGLITLIDLLFITINKPSKRSTLISTIRSSNPSDKSRSKMSKTSSSSIRIAILSINSWESTCLNCNNMSRSSISISDRRRQWKRYQPSMARKNLIIKIIYIAKSSLSSNRFFSAR